jgi:hypothetical protein
MKYLVIQSFVGSGTWLNNRDTLGDLYNNILIPSVARYCNKYNYRHVVYRDQLELIAAANEKYGDHHGNLYHQYISALKHKDEDIDYFVFPDADFYITQNALPFIQTTYLAGAPWTEEQLIARGKDPKTFKAVYGGIQIMTKEAAISLADYLKTRMINYLLYNLPIQMHPNMLTVGDWIAENDIEPEDLSFYYNHILDDIENREWTPEDNNVGFWHLYGEDKAKKMEYILNNLELNKIHG